MRNIKNNTITIRINRTKQNNTNQNKITSYFSKNSDVANNTNDKTIDNTKKQYNNTIKEQYKCDSNGTNVKQHFNNKTSDDNTVQTRPKKSNSNSNSTKFGSNAKFPAKNEFQSVTIPKMFFKQGTLDRPVK